MKENIIDFKDRKQIVRKQNVHIWTFFVVRLIRLPFVHTKPKYMLLCYLCHHLNIFFFVSTEKIWCGFYKNISAFQSLNFVENSFTTSHTISPIHTSRIPNEHTKAQNWLLILRCHLWKISFSCDILLTYRISSRSKLYEWTWKKSFTNSDVFIVKVFKLRRWLLRWVEFIRFITYNEISFFFFLKETYF